ncbi:AMP dependent CoA ligase, putative, partial [Ixodes scapularis]
LECAVSILRRHCEIKEMVLKAFIEHGIVHSPYPGGSVPKISVYQALKERLAQYGEGTALICKGKEVTYFEMLRMLQRYAAGFQSHGVKPGDKVLVHVEDSVESLVAMYGIVCAGGVVIPSEPGSEQGEVLRKLEDGNASHVLTTRGEAYLFKRLTEGTQMQITTLFADSMAVHQLAANMLRSGIRLPSVKHVVVIAIRVTERAAETIMSAFDLKSFRSMYGTTEYANVISWLPRETMEYNTIGFPAPDVKIKGKDALLNRSVNSFEDLTKIMAEANLKATFRKLVDENVPHPNTRLPALLKQKSISLKKYEKHWKKRNLRRANCLAKKARAYANKLSKFHRL